MFQNKFIAMIYKFLCTPPVCVNNGICSVCSSCFADTLVKGMTKEEEKLIVAGDKKVEMSLMMRNGDNLFACEKNLSIDAKF